VQRSNIRVEPRVKFCTTEVLLRRRFRATPNP